MVARVLWLRVAVALAVVGLHVYAFLDWLATPPAEARAFRHAVWVVLILVLPVVGPLLWLWAGRPQRPLR